MRIRLQLCATTTPFPGATPTTPLPMENRPRAVFERLVGDSTDPEERAARLRENRSILDLVNQDLKRLMKSVGESDRAKLDQYSDAVRSVEQQIQVAEQQAVKELPEMQKPMAIPDPYSDYAKLMMDLQVLAFQGDMTRVSTFMFGHEMGGRAYPELGFGDPHHSLTHHQGDAAKIAKVIQINIFHVKLMQYFFERMRSIPDGDGSLLDHSLIVYGARFERRQFAHCTRIFPFSWWLAESPIFKVTVTSSIRKIRQSQICI